MKRLKSYLRIFTAATKLPVIAVFATLLAAQAVVVGVPDHIHVVNAVGDEADSSLADGICKTVNNECTLRAAIQQANDTENLSTSGEIIIEIPDEIIFEISGSGVHTIRPESTLPIITDAVSIDGYTQGSAQPNTLDVGSDAELLIEIDGSLAGGFTHGLTLESNGSIIRGLVINRFGLTNILLDGANENHIEGNYIGTDPTGTMARRNGADGIALFDSASNVFGGASPDKRNVISGNTWSGIAILNGPSQGNVIEGNYIGTDPSGLNAVPNEQDGVLISALVGRNDYATKNRIGGVGAGQGNLISGNGRSGVQVFRGTQNAILGNLIGTKVDGASDLPNSGSGVLLLGASNNVIGGLVNSGDSGSVVTFKRNVISGNGSRGVEIFVRNQAASGNHIVANFIGTDITGKLPIPNNLGGVLLGSGVGATASVVNNFVGGSDSQHLARNIISGNGSSGVTLAGPLVSNNDVVGNIIGLDVTGLAKLGNDLDGVRFTTFGSQAAGPVGNFIGTSSATSGNVISGNGRDGVAIAFGSAGNFVVNNIIGLDATGTVTDPDGIVLSGDELGNTGHGVAIFDSPDNFVGLGSDDHNTISGNLRSGVFIGVGSVGGGATRNGITGNYIGVDITGAGSGNLGNLGDGVLIAGTPNNIVGGALAADGNVISRNGQNGIRITGADATGNKVFRNHIGVINDASTDFGNLRHGVLIGDGSSNNTIGDVADDKGNVIAFNDVSGVAVESGVGNAIRGNQIFDNGGLGIDLGDDGLTENDDGDGDSGANDLQNFPVVSSEIIGGNTDIVLEFAGPAGITYLVDVYANDTGDGISAGQGRTYLRTESVETTGEGFSIFFTELGEHRNITATTTLPNRSTSEFGREPLVHSLEFTQAIQILQPLNELLTTLKDTDEPPVPMIADKPGAMRIYLRTVQKATEVHFEIEGEGFTRLTDSLAVSPGCTPLARRRLENSCLSTDFQFTPPQGEWITTVTLKTPAGVVFERHRLRQVTRTAIPLVLLAAEICHAQDASGNWICGNKARLKPLIGLLRSIAPTHSVSVIETSYKARRHLAKDGDLWGGNVLEVLSYHYSSINAFFAAQGVVQSYLMGVTSSNISTGGIAYRPGRAAWVQESALRMTGAPVETINEVVAHETCHMLGRPHTNLTVTVSATAPGCYSNSTSSTTDWPYWDNTIQSGPTPATQVTATPEVGFNVTATGKRHLLPEETFSLLSYCVPRWIAPFDYLAIANDVLAPKPTNALSQTAVAAAPINGEFWLVAGLVEDGAAAMRPLLQFDTMGFDSPGEGSNRIEIRDAGEVVLSTRLFDLAIGATETSGEDVAGTPFFSELIPVVVDAESIVVLDALDVELGRITLAGEAPEVTVTYEPGDEPQAGPQTISWTIVDSDSSEHTMWVQYSNDNGATWHNVAIFVTGTQLQIDFDDLPGADGTSVIRVYATDGVNTGFGDSAPFSVTHKLPQVEIFFPEDGAVFRRGDIVWLQAAVSDGDDGSLDDSAIVWTSSLDGDIGLSADLPIGSLSVGVHTITVTGTDSDGNMADHSIMIEVNDSLLIEEIPVIHVPADQPTIQAGIDAAFSGGEVVVAPGTYDEIIDFHGKAITVRSSGGAEVTIIDATFVDDPGSGKPVVRCDSGEGPNTVLDGFTLTGGTGDTSMFGAAITLGGGMFINDSSPTVMNCTFSGNSAARGGGMRTLFSSASVTSCTFSGNTADQNGAGMQNQDSDNMEITGCVFNANTTPNGQGGGMYNLRCDSQIIFDCSFEGNTARVGGGMYDFIVSDQIISGCSFTGNSAFAGGGISIELSTNQTITGSTFTENSSTNGQGGGLTNSNAINQTVNDCTFSGNTALHDGGGINYIGGNQIVTGCTFRENESTSGSGGGMSGTGNALVVTDCVFIGNVAAQDGGGMFARSSPTVSRSMFLGNTAGGGGGGMLARFSPTVTDSVFSGNVAFEGGGMATFSSPEVTNCTFSKNTADFGGGFYNDPEDAFPIITNCIFWMNSDLGGTDESGQIHNDDKAGESFPTVNFSDVQGGWTGAGGVGNINSDPFFMDADGPDNVVGTEDDDLRLTPGSPCIDSGDPAFVAGLGETDLDGLARILCDRVDMGAYEFDCNLNYNLAVFSNWNACMTGPGGGPYANECAVFDFDGDLDIDLRDFAEFEKIFSP